VRKTKEDASWRNKKVFLNGAAVKNRIPGCLLSCDESRKHGNEYIQECEGPGKVLGICRRGGETIRDQWAGGSISPELESRLGMTGSRKNLKRIESLMGGRIESEVKYLIFEMRPPCPPLGLGSQYCAQRRNRSECVPVRSNTMRSISVL
jgi:hypothetical protein